MAARRTFGRLACAVEQLESRQLLSGDALATQSAGGLADPAAQAVPVLTATSAHGNVGLEWTGSQYTPFAFGPNSWWPSWTPAHSHVEQQNPDGSFTQIAFVDQLPMYSGIEGTSVAGLSVGETYTFRVGIEDGSNLIYSNPVSVTVVNQDARDVTATVLSAHSVALTWSDPGAPAGTTYNIYRSPYPGVTSFPTGPIAQHVDGTTYLDGPSSDFIDPGLDAGTQYFYAVEAILPGDGTLYGASTWASAEVSATTAPQSVTVWPADYYTVPGVVFSGIVGSFSDSTKGTTAANYSATVTWADGSASAAAIVPDGYGGFNLQVIHTFTNATGGGGKYVLRVTDSTGAVVGPVGGEAHLGSVHDVTIFPVFGYVWEGQSSIATLALFTDGASPGQPGDYSVVIAWGDGTTSSGGVVWADGNFYVAGDHDYLLPFGNSPTEARVTVTRIDRPTDSSSDTSFIYSQLNNAPSGSGTVLTAISGRPFTAKVGEFESRTFVGPAGVSFTATITWADGSTTAATVVADPSNDDSTGWQGVAHAYAIYADIIPTNTQAFSIEIEGPDGEHARIKGGQLNVGAVTGLSQFDTSPGRLTGLVYGGEMATFTDGLSPGSPDDYVATIKWDNGSADSPQITMGTITMTPDGVFHVVGYHAFVYVGNVDFVPTVTITRKPSFASLPPQTQAAAGSAQTATQVQGIDLPAAQAAAPVVAVPLVAGGSAQRELTMNPDYPPAADPGGGITRDELPEGTLWAGTVFDDARGSVLRLDQMSADGSLDLDAAAAVGAGGLAPALGGVAAELFAASRLTVSPVAAMPARLEGSWLRGAALPLGLIGGIVEIDHRRGEKRKRRGVFRQ